MGGRPSDGVNGGELDRRAIPWSSIWAHVTADFSAIFSPHPPETTRSTTYADVSSSALAAPTRTESTGIAMTTTSQTIPISTVTVEETRLRTTLVTVRFTDISPSYAPTSTSWGHQTSCTLDESSTPLPSASRDSTLVPLPPITSGEQPSEATHGPFAGAEPQDNSTASSATTDPSTGQSSQKHAIIGGLSGSIAGLVLIGLVACLLWRRRKPRFADEEDSTDSTGDKGIRPRFARKWSQFTTGSQAPLPPPPPMVMTRKSTPEPEPDGQILRVSLDNWPRPFAHDEGYRESQGPTTLRVMNPDLSSRPSTPRRPSLETAGSFLKRQRNALAAALYGRPGSRADSPQRGLPVPASNFDPALSTEFLAPKAIAPSVRSASTNNSATIVVSQAPEDPFLTPPDETQERAIERITTRPPSAARPGVMPLQGAAGGAMRTLSNRGRGINLFRTRSNASSTRSTSRRSVSTFSSTGDPFHLQPNTAGGSGRPVQDHLQRGMSGGGSVTLYEGT